MPKDPVEVANSTGISTQKNLLAEVEQFLGGNKTAQKNDAYITGGPQCNPVPIRSQLNQPTTGGLLTAVESEVFQVFQVGALPIALDSAIYSSPLIVPPGFYFRVDGLMCRIDDEPSTVDCAVLICQQGASQPNEDWWVDASAVAQGANPNGILVAGSNIGFIVATGPDACPIIPGGFAIIAQFFRATASTNTGNCVFTVMGVLIKDVNYEGFRHSAE